MKCTASPSETVRAACWLRGTTTPLSEMSGEALSGMPASRITVSRVAAGDGSGNSMVVSPSESAGRYSSSSPGRADPHLHRGPPRPRMAGTGGRSANDLSPSCRRCRFHGQGASVSRNDDCELDAHRRSFGRGM